MGPVRGGIEVNARQRFKPDRPCPVCGGHADLRRGEGRRCDGFISGDGLYAHCTREEHAGGLDRNGNSNTHAHHLKGGCDCGKQHGTVSARPDIPPGASQDAPSVHSYRDPRLGHPDQVWAYRDAGGEVVGYAVRWDRPDGGGKFCPLTFVDGRWRRKGIPRPRPLYNLPELLNRPGAPVLVVKGEGTSDAARGLFPAHVPVTSIDGAKAPRLSDWGPLKGRDVAVLPSNDPEGQRYAQVVEELVKKAGASTVRIVQLPEGLPAGWDLADPVPEGVDVERLLADAGPVADDVGEPDADREGDVRGQSSSTKDRLLSWAGEAAELFRDGEDTYADVQIDGRRETLLVHSKGFRRWLRRLHRERTEKGATHEALTHVEENLDAQAACAAQRSVYVRTATHDGRLYIDLCDCSRHVVEIDSEGWRVLVDAPTVRFRRPGTAGPLPEPVRGDVGEGLSALRSFLNMGEGDFVLCVAWLLASLRDTGPYPLLVLAGEQGSAKSTAAKLLRLLVDPVRAPITGMPRSERDAVIAARNRHVLAYDNLSGLPAWLSDTLCRLSTGEGYATRALYTNDEEVVIETSRPVILTGIENPAVRDDLADRSLIVRLSPISDADRRTESELMATFEEVRPRIFGALLDGLSEGLRRYGGVYLERLPRMADFCKWAVACEGAYWPPGTFMTAYDHAQASVTEDVIEETAVGPALRLLLDENGTFDGSATELLDLLNALPQYAKRPRGWPSTGAVMGKQLTTVAPTLRKLGYTVEPKRTNQGNFWELESSGRAAGAG